MNIRAHTRTLNVSNMNKYKTDTNATDIICELSTLQQRDYTAGLKNIPREGSGIKKVEALVRT